MPNNTDSWKGHLSTTTRESNRVRHLYRKGQRNLATLGGVELRHAIADPGDTVSQMRDLREIG